MNFKLPLPLYFKFNGFVFIFLLVTFFSPFGLQKNAHARDLILVVHNSNPLESISKSDLIRIYLGKKTFFQEGVRITPLDFGPKKMIFYEEVLKRPFNLIKRYWTKAIFSGQGSPPMEFNNENDVVNYLQDKPGGIAYLPSDTKNENLKILKITP